MEDVQVSPQTLLILAQAKRIRDKQEELMNSGISLRQFDEIIQAVLLDFESCLPEVKLSFDSEYSQLIDGYFREKITAQNVVNILVGELALEKQYDQDKDHQKLYKDKRELRNANSWEWE